jgi:hypothetical protein
MRTHVNGELAKPVNRDPRRDTFSAEIAAAAYRVALRARTKSTWLDLELDLWKAVGDAVKSWEAHYPTGAVQPSEPGHNS